MKDELRESAKDAAWKKRFPGYQASIEGYLASDFEPSPANRAAIERRQSFNEDFDAGYEAGKPKWIPIRSADDLPKEYGEYYATTIVETDPFATEPRVIKAVYDDITKDRFWLGSFSAWMPIVKPEPYTEGE